MTLAWLLGGSLGLTEPDVTPCSMSEALGEPRSGRARPGEEGEGWMASREAEGSGTPREDPDSWRDNTWRAVSDCCLTSGCLELGSILTGSLEAGVKL